MSDEKQGVTRRDFGKAAAAVSFAAWTARPARAEVNTETLKIGLVGCGGRGTGALIDHLRGNDNVVLVGMADVFQDRIDGAKARFGKVPEIASKLAIEEDRCFVGFDAYRKLLATDIDIMIHATTPYIRPVHVAAAVEAGKHIFTEKPSATDPKGIRLFIEAAKKAEKKGLTLVAGTQRRHEKSYVETIKQILDGKIGEILSARAYWCGTLPFAYDRKEGMSDLEYRLRNWYSYCWVCGDNIVEQHVHNLDIINWVMGGPPAKVMASGGRAWKPRTEKYGDIYDHFSCDYEYPNGVHLLSMSRHWNNSHNNVSEAVVGTKGQSSCRDMAKDDRNPYEQEHIDLTASIRGTGPYLNEGVRVAQSTMTAIMGRMSAYTGKQYTYDEALNEDLALVPAELDFTKAYPVGPIPVPGT